MVMHAFHALCDMPTKMICFSDDMDGFRKVPTNVPNQEMLSAYSQLHQMGVGHSVEVHDGRGQLVGGLYGLAQGRAFFGESMFSLQPDASKVALVALVDILLRGDFGLIDCQVESKHLTLMGARNINRLDFEALLAHTVDKESDPGIWQLPVDCGDLL